MSVDNVLIHGDRIGLKPDALSVITSSPSIGPHVTITDETVIEDEEGLKSVDRLVQSEWLIQTSHMGYHFTP